MYILIAISLFFADSTVNYYDQVVEAPLSDDPRIILQGEELFNNQCAVCHRFDKQLIGPALASVTSTRPIPWLKDFIRNSQKVIDSGDEYAYFIFNQYDRVVMPNFDFLTEKELEAILAYMEYESKAPHYIAGSSGAPENNYAVDAPRYNYLREEDQQGQTFEYVLYGLVAITFLLTIFTAYKFVTKLKEGS